MPAARHRLVERGYDSTALVQFAMSVASCALLPFAAAMGLDFYIAAERLWGSRLGIAGGTTAFALVLGLWFGLPFAMRAHRRAADEEDIVEKPKLADRIVQVLTETRVVLPGAQALLGFQLAMLLMDSFDRLEPFAQTLHFASLCFIVATTAMLMAPAAWHRVAERGKDTERFERFASAMVLGALASLSSGLSLELAVVTSKWTGSIALALSCGGICLALLLALWFGLTFVLRMSSRKRAYTRP